MNQNVGKLRVKCVKIRVKLVKNHNYKIKMKSSLRSQVCKNETFSKQIQNTVPRLSTVIEISTHF